MRSARFDDASLDRPAAAGLPPAAERTPLAEPGGLPRPRGAASGRARRVPAARWYERSLLTVALLGVLSFAAALWYVGAFFTVRFFDTLPFLHALGIDVVEWGLWRWALPVVLTAIEIAFWPRQWQRLPRHLVFGGTLLFDAGTTCSGLIVLGLAGATIPLFGGVTLPNSPGWLTLIGVALGVLLAIGPEKIARWAAAELRTTWQR